VVDLVYFLRAGEAVKIGHTSDLKARIRALETGSAHRIVPLGVVPGDQAIGRAIHHRLDAHRMNGEWFSPHRDVFDLLAALQASGPDAVLGEISRAPRDRPRLPAAPALRVDSAIALDERISQLMARLVPKGLDAAYRSERESGLARGTLVAKLFPHATNFTWESYIALRRSVIELLDRMLECLGDPLRGDRGRASVRRIAAHIDSFEEEMARVVGEQEVRLARRAFECALQNAARGNVREDDPLDDEDDQEDASD